MFVGLFVSFLTGITVASNPNMINNIYNSPLLLIIILLQIGVVVFLSTRIDKMSLQTAIISFLTYSFISGLTLSTIFLIYELNSLITVFGITSIVFLIFGLVGYTTNRDLSKLGSIAFMGLLAVIIVGLINLFIKSAGLDFGLTIFGILIFIAFIAYDIQKIKAQMDYALDENKLAIISALRLYLDFINLFIRLLSLFGSRRD